MHFLVGKLDDVVFDEQAVGGQGEAEILVVELLLLPGVGHHILDHLPVHQRFAAEEVHLQIPAGTGMGNEEINGLLTHFQGHESPVALVLALAGKAVVTGQVAGVGHMET